jgi:hypothetical protein
MAQHEAVFLVADSSTVCKKGVFVHEDLQQDLQAQ